MTLFLVIVLLAAIECRMRRRARSEYLSDATLRNLRYGRTR